MSSQTVSIETQRRVRRLEVLIDQLNQMKFMQFLALVQLIEALIDKTELFLKGKLFAMYDVFN